MIAPARPTPATPGDDLHRRFVNHVLPAVELHAKVQFRSIPGQDRQDAIQEARSFGWKMFLQVIDRGKDPTKFPSRIADFAVRRVWSGRVFAKETSRDALSPLAQRRHSFEVYSLDDESCDPNTGWKAAVCQDTRTAPPADTVAFRMDFADWLGNLTWRERRVAERLAVGDRPGSVATDLDVTRSRVSQVRRKLHESWEAFVGDQDGDNEE